MNIFYFVQSMKNCSKLNDKIELIKSLDEDGKLCLQYAFNNFIRFNLATPIAGSIDINDYPKDINNDLKPFFDIVNYILEKGTMNNEIKDKIRDVYINYTFGQACILDDILTKTLSIGANIKTINKALNEEFIPEFELMRCVPYNKKNIKRLINKKVNLILQPKLDGQRCTFKFNRNNKGYEILSRTGKIILTSNKKMINELLLLSEQLSNKLYQHPTLKDAEYIWIDGEIMSEVFEEGKKLTEVEQFKVFTKLMESKKSDGDNNNTFNIFSYFVTKGDEIGVCNEFARTQNLKTLDYTDFDNVKLIETKYIENTNFEDTNKIIDDFYEDCISKGYEGSIVKSVDSLYEFKRSNDWVKIKPVENADLILVDIEEGSGKYTNMAGNLVLEGHIIDKQNNKIEVKTGCGSGLTDNLRQYFWDNKNTLIGSTIEIEYTQLTADNSLRHAVFKVLRDDK